MHQVPALRAYLLELQHVSAIAVANKGSQHEDILIP